jgi:two-component system NtrC family sensor kinase
MSAPAVRLGAALVPEAIKALLEASTDAAVVLDDERRIVYYNRAYQLAAGARGRALAAAAAAGARCHEIFPLDVCAMSCVGCQALDSGRPLRVELVGAVRGDGEALTLAVTAAPIQGAHGGTLIVETYRDITADVRIQRKYKVLLTAAADELRRTQAQLIHQEKMSSLGRLVAGIAHELNNPINFVYGNVDFLGRYMEDLLSLVALYEEAPLPAELAARIAARRDQIELDFLIEDSRKLIRSIRAGAERTAGIVRDLKVFSRTSTGPMRETDIVAGLETTLNLVAPLVKNRIEIVRDYAQPHPMVTCHAGHINQVFMNILTNAAQAIDGTGRVTVSVAPEGSGVRIAIADTGPGVAREIQEKIFDPFFTTKDVGEGTGLGLAISESIVRAHGGAIRCESTPGQGATFIVTLPAQPPDPT